jgi:hypothetical protein
MQYVEQLGSKRQQLPISGDSTTLYARTRKISTAQTAALNTLNIQHPALDIQ